MTLKHLINPYKCNTYHSPMLRIFLVLKQNTIQDYTRGDASSINKHKNLHRADIKEHTQARTTFNGNP